MEEWVGEKWHNFIIRKSTLSYPQSQVKLSGFKSQLGVFFRALGGDKSYKIESSVALKNYGYKKFLQKIAGSNKRIELPHFGSEQFFLPSVISCFNNESLNKDLYIWLTALASFGKEKTNKETWIIRNQKLSQEVLNQWPGLEKKYNKLVAEHLKQRLNIEKLPLDLHALETTIIESLKNPFNQIKFIPKSRFTPQVVPLWIYDAPQLKRKSRTELDKTVDDSKYNDVNKHNFKKKFKAEQIEENQSKGGLLSFRLESLFSWSEFINLDRSPDDTKDDDALDTAEDLDHLSLTTGETSHKIKLDLDFPSEEYDDQKISGEILLPEYDYKQNALQEEFCSLFLMESKLETNNNLPASLKRQAIQLRRQFDRIRPQRQWFNNQIDGDEIDINSYINFNTDKLLGKLNTDPKLYRQLKNTYRDLSCLLLADLSLSTDTYANNDKKIIDIIRESLFLFAESLNSCNDPFAIAGFSSKRREHIRYYPIKDFEQKYNNDVVVKINCIKPGYFTRMGAAIRYATLNLKKQKTAQKLLLILTDGKPNDLDKYESRYGIEDTKRAILEAKHSGLKPFCVSIDQYSSDYLPYIFGSKSFIHIKRVEELPRKLPLLYLQLTTNI